MKRKLKKYLTVVLVLSLTLCNVNNSNAASKVSITKKKFIRIFNWLTGLY